jgi:hypothetical protein
VCCKGKALWRLQLGMWLGRKPAVGLWLCELMELSLGCGLEDGGRAFDFDHFSFPSCSLLRVHYLQQPGNDRGQSKKILLAGFWLWHHVLRVRLWASRTVLSGLLEERQSRWPCKSRKWIEKGQESMVKPHHVSKYLACLRCDVEPDLCPETGDIDSISTNNHSNQKREEKDRS